MNVELIDFTGAGRPDEEWHAAHILLFTKNTRLTMTAEGLAEVAARSEADKLTSLEYMATTIPSSWEFVSLTFLISGVTRAAAQQITRTRNASYAMQSQRVVDMTGAEVINPFYPGSFAQKVFQQSADIALAHYKELLTAGADKQDARGILPLNVTTNLVARYTFRSFVDLVRARSSLRTQGEYADLVAGMKEIVEGVWPWSAPFFRPRHESAIRLIESAVEELGMEVGGGAGWKLAKAADLLRSEG